MAYIKTPLHINFNEKDVAKKYNASWDSSKKRWYMFHFDDWKSYNKSNVSQNAYETLQAVNQIAKELNKDIFDILPAEYREHEKTLQNILTMYGRQMRGIFGCSDVLYHPDTYYQDLIKAKSDAEKLSSNLSPLENKEYWQKVANVVSSNYQKLIDEYKENNVQLSNNKDDIFTEKDAFINVIKDDYSLDHVYFKIQNKGSEGNVYGLIDANVNEIETLKKFTNTENWNILKEEDWSPKIEIIETPIPKTLIELMKSNEISQTEILNFISYNQNLFDKKDISSILDIMEETFDIDFSKKDEYER